MSQAQEGAKRTVFVSVRTKLLATFTLLFLLAFSGVFLWFYNFATELAMQNLRRDLLATAMTAASAIDGDEFVRLYESGQMDDAAYTAVAESLREVKRTNPKAAGIYTYLQAPGEEGQVRFVVSAALPPGVEPSARDVALSQERLSGCQIPPASRPEMGESYGVADGLSPTMLNGIREAGVETEILPDQWGEWLSGYAPITNSAGEPVGAVGVDMCAADVVQLQENIRRTILPVLVVTLLLLAGLVFAVARGVTQPIIHLTRAADRIGQGDYTQDLSALHAGLFRDEVARLAEVFEIMMAMVRGREERLKEQVARLQIIIDEAKRKKQVADITESDFFYDLQQKARTLRSRKREGSE